MMAGSSTVSAAAVITVQPLLPGALLALISPLNGASFTMPAAINMAATMDGTVLGVGFY